MPTKTYPADVILSVYDGHLMCRNFGEVHDLMDHFYPGIMTIGCVAMQPAAAAELLRQFPVLAELSPFEQPWDAWRDKAMAAIPATFDVAGPLKPR